MRVLSTSSRREERVTDRFENGVQRFGHALFSPCREWPGNGPAVSTFLLVRGTFPGGGRDSRRRHGRRRDRGSHACRPRSQQAGTEPGRADRRPRPRRRRCGGPAPAVAAAPPPPARRRPPRRGPHPSAPPRGAPPPCPPPPLPPGPPAPPAP